MYKYRGGKSMKDIKVLSKKDHELAIEFQKKHGITLGDFLKVLEVGTIAVDSHNDKTKINVDYERVIPNLVSGTWDFVNPKPEIGKGRNMAALGETYTLTAPEMEDIAVKTRTEELAKLKEALESLKDIGADKTVIDSLTEDIAVREKALADFNA